MQTRIAFWKRLLYGLLIGAGVLGALAPFESRLAGLAGAAAIILLGRSLVRERLRTALAWSIAATLSVTLIAFHWVYFGLVNIAGLAPPLAVAGLLVQGLLFQSKIACVLLFGRWLVRKSRLQPLWVFAALGALSDLVLYQLFPWRFGDLMIGGEYVRQLASLGGAHALSFFIFVEAGVVLWLLRIIRQLRRGYRPSPRSLATRRMGLPVALLILAYAWGIWRVQLDESAAKVPGTSGESVRVGMLQPNTGPGFNQHRDDSEFAGRALNLVFNEGLRTVLAGKGRLDLLLIPESAIPFFGTDDAAGNEQIYSPTFHAVVAFLARYGNVDVVYNELVAHPERSGSYFNQATVLSGGSGERAASYRKRRLVPFGEYLPGEATLPWLRDFFAEVSRYIPGKAGEGAGVLPYRFRQSDAERTPLPRLSQDDLVVLDDPAAILGGWPREERLSAEARFSTGGGAFQPLICYEGLFPGLVRDLIREAETPPDFLVNLVNDSWFGDHLENHHHESGARMRAIESDRYLVRASLTGVSTVFDARGFETIAPMEVGARDIRVFIVPRRPAAQTLYLRYGDVPVWGLCAFVLVFAFWRRRSLISKL